MRLLLLTTTPLTIVAGLAAQQNKFVDTWPANPVPHVLEAQTIGTNNAGYTVNGCLGVSAGAGGHVYWTARGNASAKPHFLMEVDSTGAWVGSYASPETTASTWGHRDGTTDDAGVLGQGAGMQYWGIEGNVLWAFDTTTSAWDTSKNITLSGYGSSTTRAVAINNDCFGTGAPGIVATEWSNPVEYFDATGAVKHGTSPSIAQWVYGLASTVDGTDRIWHHSQNNVTTAHPSGVACNMAQSDNMGNDTGQRLIGDPTIPGGTNVGGIAGGLDIDPATGTMYALTQATIDSIQSLDPAFDFGIQSGGDLGADSFGYVGNANFAIKVDGVDMATYGTVQFVAGIANQAGSPLPPFITGNLYLNLGAGLISVGGPTPLNLGSATVALPIPNNPAAAGVVMAYQGLMYRNDFALPFANTEGGWQEIQP